MSASILVNNEKAIETVVYVADYEHIAANATSSNQVTIAKIPAGGAPLFCYAVETTALAGASDITLDVGTTSGDPDEFIDAWDADSGTPAVNTGDQLVQADGTTTFAAGWKPGTPVTSDTDVLAEWNGTVASLTAGKCVIVFAYLNPAKFA